MSNGKQGQATQAKHRVEEGLEALRLGLDGYVSKHMKDRYGPDWRAYASSAGGGGAARNLDLYAQLKTLLDNWNDLFRHDEALRKARSFISIAMDARNRVAHFSGEMAPRQALRYLDALGQVADAVGASAQVSIIDRLHAEQLGSDGGQHAAEVPALALDEREMPKNLRPWRDICEPHSDVMDSAFSDAEFAADLAQVDQGVGREEYLDPSAFFKRTYATEGLTRILEATVSRLAGGSGEPVIGLQTNFGGGKTHTMLALYHLAGAADAGYRPETLAGMAPIFEAAGVSTLGTIKRAVFVGTSKGPAETMHVENGREIRTLWGYLAWCLGGWSAFARIEASERQRVNPGSERMISILRDAAPCLILLDEVVAFARQLRDVEYDAFHTFIQSLTEAAKAVDGVVVVGSLPESATEVGDQQGRDALQRLEKIFGRVQSAWTPASGHETFEIVRRRLFQPLDEDAEKARDAVIREFARFYRKHRSDFPAEVREAAYTQEMRLAYPIHPEVLRKFSGNWSVLDKFQRTRGVLKIMANVVYALWSGESSAPLITPALLPFGHDKVRTALTEPLHRAYGPILQSEVDGDQSLTARLEASRPRFGKPKAARAAARAVFFATAPHAGTERGGITLAEVRLACAQPDDQIAIYGEALQEIAASSAHLYREGDSYWFSPQPTLNKLASDRAANVTDEKIHHRITAILREDERNRAGFARVHGAPDNPPDVDDQRSTALVILPPNVTHDSSSGQESSAARLASETIERRGSGQRLYRNTLIFLAADSSLFTTVRDNARREQAWQSILDDEDLIENLTRAQTRDALEQAERSRDALRQSIRGAWVHVLYPERPPDGRPGHTIHSTRLVNRGGAKSLPEAVRDKVMSDGTVLDTLGPDNLVRELKALWREDDPHIAIVDIRDWFATYIYLPRLRDEATLLTALQRLCTDWTQPYTYSSGSEDGVYQGVVDGKAEIAGDITTGLLVRRDAVQRTDADDDELETGSDDEQEGEEENGDTGQDDDPKLTRFFAAVPLDPDRPGLDAARIVDGLYAELVRTRGSTLRITLEFDGSSSEEGYPDDVVNIVKDNVRDMQLKPDSFGFE